MSKNLITNRQIYLFVLPIFLESLAQNLLNITDTAFMGRLGEVSLGASAIGGIFYYVFTMLSLGLAIGTQIIIARRVGENKPEEIGKILFNVQTILILLALIVFSLVYLLKERIVFSVVSSDAIAQETLNYINIRVFGLFAAVLNSSFRAFYVGIAKTKIISFTTVVITTINLIFNYLLIFGNYGFPEMKIAGAALASVMAETAGLMTFLLVTYNKQNQIKYLLFKYHQLNKKIIQNILNVSFPIMFQYFISIVCWLLFFLFIEKMGQTELAVSNIIRSVYIFILLPVWGFSSAANSFTSQLIGKGHPEEVLNLIFRVVKLCLPIIIILITVMAIIPQKVLMIFTNDLMLIEKAIPVFYVVLGASPLLTTGFIIFYSLTGTGKTIVAMQIEFLALLFYTVLAWLFSNILNLHIAIVWVVEWLYAIIIGFSSYYYLKTKKWINTKV